MRFKAGELQASTNHALSGDTILDCLNEAMGLCRDAEQSVFIVVTDDRPPATLETTQEKLRETLTKTLKRLDELA